MTVRRIVKCPECLTAKVTYANRDFKCCGKHWDITENLIKGESEPKSQVKSNIENADSNSAPIDLEFEEEEPENPLDKIKEQEEAKIFNCPNCQTELNEYQTPCPKCFYEIEWQ